MSAVALAISPSTGQVNLMYKDVYTLYRTKVAPPNHSSHWLLMLLEISTIKVTSLG